MWSLPFVPNAYSDEVLGTWLARIQVLNGSGAWRMLFESAGAGSTLTGPLFDLVNHSESLARVFEGLHTDYTSAILQRTTLPYWSALAGDEARRVPGVPQLRMPQTRANIPALDLVLLRRTGFGKLQVHRWYCPVCIALDREEGRLPYLRRRHQLPTVFHCLEHRVPLQHGCPKCGADIFIGRPDLFLVETACPCGFDLLSAPVQTGCIPPFFRRLAKVSEDALNIQSVDWSLSALRAWLTDRLSALGGRL